MTLKYFYRSLQITLAFAGSFAMTAAKGAEFIPLEFDVSQQRSRLVAFQMSENGRVVSAEEGLGDYVHLWTAEDGVLDIAQELRQETLSSDPLIARLSADGKTGLGFSRGSDSLPFVWSFENSTAELLTDRDGYSALAMSDDGSVAAGTSYTGPSGSLSGDAYIWSKENGSQSLSPVDEDVAFAPWPQVSGNSAVIAAVVVRGPFPGLFDRQQGAPVGSRSDLVRWVDGQPTVLGEVSTGARLIRSTALIRSISHDGRVIAGYSPINATVEDEVFRWTKADGIVGLGFEGRPYAMSWDGSVIAGGVGGDSMTPGSREPDAPGFIWTEATGGVFFEGVTFSDITAAGDVAVGREFEGGAVVWDPANGKRYLQDILEENVSMAEELEGWTLTQALQISDDGFTLSGRGTDPFGNDLAYWLVSLDEPLVARSLGDFDSNGVLIGGDIDLITMAIQSDSFVATFDLNGDLAVDLQDHAFWIDELANTFPGDANLDGKVEFADFLVLSANFGNDGGWADGDFNASMTVDFADFLLLSENFGNSNELAASVPEPATTWLVTLPALFAARRRRRQFREYLLEIIH